MTSSNSVQLYNGNITLVALPTFYFEFVFLVLKKNARSNDIVVSTRKGTFFCLTQVKRRTMNSLMCQIRATNLVNPLNFVNEKCKKIFSIFCDFSFRKSVESVTKSDDGRIWKIPVNFGALSEMKNAT